MISDIDLVMLTYNREDTIEASLKSVANWKFTNAICVDHYSTDNTVKIFRKYFPLGKILYENRGLGFARTIAVSEAKSSFFLFLDSDIALPENFLEVISKYVSKSVGAIQGKRYFNDPFWGKVIEARLPKGGYRKLTKQDRPFTGATLIRGEAAKGADLSRYKIMEDYFLMRHIQSKSYSWLEAFVPVETLKSSMRDYGNIKARLIENDGAAMRLYGVKSPARFFLEQSKYSLRDIFYAIKMRQPWTLIKVVRVHLSYVRGYVAPTRYLSWA